MNNCSQFQRLLYFTMGENCISGPFIFKLTFLANDSDCLQKVCYLNLKKTQISEQTQIIWVRWSLCLKRGAQSFNCNPIMCVENWKNNLESRKLAGTLFAINRSHWPWPWLPFCHGRGQTLWNKYLGDLRGQEPKDEITNNKTTN